MVTEETIMVITSDTLHKNFSKQDLLFNGRLFHYRIVLQLDFVRLEWYKYAYQTIIIFRMPYLLLCRNGSTAAFANLILPDNIL